MIDDDLEKDLKKANREKQRRFYNMMVNNGFKRRHNWFSKRAQELLDELAQNYTKEVVIEESLELLMLAKKRFPDTFFTDETTLEKLLPTMQASQRYKPEHFREAKEIAKQRIKKVKMALESIPNNNNDNDKHNDPTLDIFG